jgi:hypothetical protein
VALARTLTYAQELAGTPENARLGETKLIELEDGPHLVISPSMDVRIGEFYEAALDMLGNLFGIVRACERGCHGLYVPVCVIRKERRLIGLLPGFTIHPGPDLFVDTLLRALAGRDVRRIRICPKCPRFFIAVPSDKIACSRKCAIAQRVDKFLTNHPGYYAKKQRQRRASRRKCDSKRAFGTQSKT